MQQSLSDLMGHPYPYQIFATVLGFALVFRTNSALARYSTAVQMCTQMTSRWLDAGTELVAFLRKGAWRALLWHELLRFRVRRTRRA